MSQSKHTPPRQSFGTTYNSHTRNGHKEKKKYIAKVKRRKIKQTNKKGIDERENDWNSMNKKKKKV